MLRKREEKKLVMLDLICLVISILAIFLFTALFIFVESDMRYAAIFFEGYAVWSFASSAKNIEDYLRKTKIKKNVQGKVSLTTADNFSIL